MKLKNHLKDFHNELEKSLHPFEPGLFYFLLFVVAIGIPLCIHFHLIGFETHEQILQRLNNNQ
jgi:hypothetical protein